MMNLALASIDDAAARRFLDVLHAADVSAEDLAALVRAARAASAETADPALVDVVALLSAFLEPDEIN